MILPGGGCRLQTCRGLAAQWFDSTLRTKHIIVGSEDRLGYFTASYHTHAVGNTTHEVIVINYQAKRVSGFHVLAGRATAQKHRNISIIYATNQLLGTQFYL